MSDFRRAQAQAHPSKTNTVMLGILAKTMGIAKRPAR